MLRWSAVWWGCGGVRISEGRFSGSEMVDEVSACGGPFSPRMSALIQGILYTGDFYFKYNLLIYLCVVV